MAGRSATCRDCGGKSARGMCPACKRDRRRLNLLHLRWRAAEGEADREERQRRVELYRARAAAELDLFA